MMINADEINIELLIVIVNNGLGSKILKYAKQNGITGGTIFLGKGTWNFLTCTTCARNLF